MSDFLKSASQKIKNISESKLTIYDAKTVEDTKHWLILEELEAILNKKMTGIDFQGVPIKTRSKQSKQIICEILGYPVPKSFKRLNPVFLAKTSIYTIRNQSTSKFGMKKLMF